MSLRHPQHGPGFRFVQLAVEPDNTALAKGLFVSSIKPEILIDLEGNAAAALKACSSLARLRDSMSHHEQLDLRHPLGIYNVSIARLFGKVRACCERAEVYWRVSEQLKVVHQHAELRQELIDYLELCIYAAAEHVDDAESIASCFFANSHAYAKSQAVRGLKSDIKVARDRISAFANAIKHAHARIRLFSLEFKHDRKVQCMHGFFLEGVKNGVIGPSKIVHGSKERIVSLTSFLWSIVTFASSISDAISAFLESISACREEPVSRVESRLFADAVIALARLPLYSFDDVHPFTRVRVVLNYSEEFARSRLTSNLYGSLLHRWTKSHAGQFGSYVMAYEGDGTSRSFQTTVPTSLHLQHWECVPPEMTSG